MRVHQIHQTAVRGFAAPSTEGLLFGTPAVPFSPPRRPFHRGFDPRHSCCAIPATVAPRTGLRRPFCRGFASRHSATSGPATPRTGLRLPFHRRVGPATPRTGLRLPFRRRVDPGLPVAATSGSSLHQVPFLATVVGRLLRFWGCAQGSPCPCPPPGTSGVPIAVLHCPNGGKEGFSQPARVGLPFFCMGSGDDLPVYLIGRTPAKGPGLCGSAPSEPNRSCIPRWPSVSPG